MKSCDHKFPRKGESYSLICEKPPKAWKMVALVVTKTTNEVMVAD